ncbi:FH2 domain-containing protein 1-like [Eublepharis macularius]|uniref:FH2 domain-containing protein 1-like n=1 Tax=Eublepharis macularius TaxID=481883 RepID=A0AA97KTE3_EUBMA|nr:FH2 domain-containing protein 1-like [Eublepharis macularius]
MLPDGEEVKKLAAFRGNQKRLSEAESFAVLLVQVPSYARRLELLVLKEEFFPRLNTLQSALQIMTEAALELLDCEELHELLHLVLEAGNFVNEGGYAGSALGFRLPSLLKLADTKANRPGVDLLHFVAQEAEKRDPRLLFFPRKLPHVGPASRIFGLEVVAELQSLGQRVLEAQEGLEALGLKSQMEPFLRAAEAELSAVRASLDSLNRATAALCDFFCEEPENFCLVESCRIFQAFGERFLLAAQENRAREVAERQRRQRQEQARQKKKRRSIATCSAQDPGLQDVELDLLFLGAPPSGRRSRALRGPHPPFDTPQGRERPLPLSRRHTLAALAPCPEPAPPPEDSSAAVLPSKAQRARLFGQSLKALLSPPPASPPKEPGSPGASRAFRFPALFQKKLLPRVTETPASPQASPRDVSALVGFFRRLSTGERPQLPSQA